MLNFNALIENEYKNAYESAYDLSLKKEFSSPKIYTAKDDLSKRWYVYFSYRNPKTGKLVRQTPIYGGANKYKTKEERLTVLTVYRKVILKYLKLGYNPYSDNSELHKNYEQKKSIKEVNQDIEIINNQPTTIITNHNKLVEQNNETQKQITLKDAFDFDMEVKEQTLQSSSLRSYSSHVRIFKEWLKDNKPNIITINEVDKNVVAVFLHEILTNTSARNRNNYRASLSSFFSTLEEYEMIEENFIKKIKVYKTQSKRNKTYTKIQQKEIFDYLEMKDQLLLLFIKFVSYNFLRPIEVCRLRIGDIDLENRILIFQAKNSLLKTKIIPNLLIKEIPDLSQYDKESFLFTPKGLGKEWDATEENKRNYFSKRFKKVVKEKFMLGKEYGMYSFRHTFITKIYREIRKTATPFEAKSNLMQITGHTSMQALDQYLRDIDAELPEDYSSLIND